MGVFSRSELLASGMGPSAITYRTKTGALTRLLPQVFCDEPPTHHERCLAVGLWRPDAVISHDTAAWLWGLIDDHPTSVHATVPRTASTRAPAWVQLHRCVRSWSVPYRGVWVIPAEQCLLDCATTMNQEQLERMIDRAVDTHVDMRAVARLCARSRNRTGMSVLRAQLRSCCPKTLSEPERLVARAVTARGIRMSINGRVGRYYGDLVDYRARVVVEVDGREFHTDAETFTQDRVRQNELVLGGWLVLRYSAARVMAGLDIVADEIAAVVRRRRHSRT